MCVGVVYFVASDDSGGGSMTAPSAKVRELTYRRDGHRCVSCGSIVRLEWQHRAAVGMGGSKRKPDASEGITSCTICNAGYESELQTRALLCGWKVRRFCRLTPSQIPCWYPIERAWFLLNTDGSRDELIEDEAMELMILAGVS